MKNTNILKQHFKDWINCSWDWLKCIGVDESMMVRHEHPNSALAHYAKACTDIKFRFPFGMQVGCTHSYHSISNYLGTNGNCG